MSRIEFSYESPALGYRTTVTAIIPSIDWIEAMRGMKAADFYEKKYPALWLLHGTSGDNDCWVRFTRIESWAEQNKIAIFMSIDTRGKNEEEVVPAAIAGLEDFFHRLGLPTKMSEMPEIKEPVTEETMYRMAKRVRITNDDGTVGGFRKLNTQDIVNIFKLAN